MSHVQRSPFLLEWNESESIECNAQGIISNGTDNIWISCKKYIGRGKLVQWNSLNSTPSRPLLRMEQWNWHALNGTQTGNVNVNKSYQHIGDGDYVELEANGSQEIWFGIEDGNWPRVLPAAIVRYDAETLEYIDMHVHDNMKTMPFLAFHKARQIAYTANWTDNFGQMIVFDATTMTWSKDNATINGLPKEFYKHEIPFIQGSEMKDDTLFLMMDDFQSTLLEIQMYPQGTYGGELKTTSYLGLGLEREGITIVNDWLLSFGNRWKSWEGNHYAQIVGVTFVMPSDPQRIFVMGMFTGFFIGLMAFATIVTILWKKMMKKSKSSYVEVDEDINQMI
jgi:hypothetical protein